MGKSWRRRLIQVLVVVVIVAGAAAFGQWRERRHDATTKPAVAAVEQEWDVPGDAGERPNLLLITTDDQTDDELDWMPRTQEVFAEGTEFVDGIASHPLCCPARAEILTGEYAQNTGVRHNDGPHGGYRAFMDNTGGDHLGVWLQHAGYTTAFIGKSLNENVGDGRVMPGWDWWDPSMQGTYAYFSTTFHNNGDPQTFDETHSSDVVRDKTIERIEEYAEDDKPFFIWASHVAPHDGSDFNGNWGGPAAAERHAGLFQDEQLPAGGEESFNEVDLSDKPGQVRLTARNARSLEEQTQRFRERIRSLQAVDEANAAMIEALDAAGELDNTLVVFVSDNGFQLGEHGLYGKNYPYEESLQIPFLLRGPGVPAGEVTRQAARLVDIAPTFLDAAGVLEEVRASGRTDGTSLLDVLAGTKAPNTSLIQAGTANAEALEQFGWRWRGVRTSRYTWVRWFNGRQELYDRKRDPLQLNNLIGRDGRVLDRAYRRVRVELRERYEALAECKGAEECQRVFPPTPRVVEQWELTER